MITVSLALGWASRNSNVFGNLLTSAVYLWLAAELKRLELHLGENVLEFQPHSNLLYFCNLVFIIGDASI